MRTKNMLTSSNFVRSKGRRAPFAWVVIFIQKTHKVVLNVVGLHQHHSRHQGHLQDLSQYMANHGIKINGMVYGIQDVIIIKKVYIIQKQRRAWLYEFE
jgi:hypothetical protein